MLYVVLAIVIPPECIAYDTGRRALHDVATAAAATGTVAAWALLARRRRLAWALPFVILAVLVGSYTLAEVAGDVLRLDEDASSACV